MICCGGASSAVVTDSSLSAGVRSSWSASAMAVKRTSAEVSPLTRTTTSPLAVSSTSSVPTVHVTIRPDRRHWPVAGLVTCAETKVTPASRAPVRTVLVAAAGPSLRTDQS